MNTKAGSHARKTPAKKVRPDLSQFQFKAGDKRTKKLASKGGKTPRKPKAAIGD